MVRRINQTEIETYETEAKSSTLLAGNGGSALKAWQWWPGGFEDVVEGKSQWHFRQIV